MKAPLRYAFGWVLYLAIFAAVNPVALAIWRAVQVQPVIVPVVTAIVGVVLLIWFHFRYLQHFWSWCDKPRQKPNEAV